MEQRTTDSPTAVLVTGGTSGIGLATAQLLHERGHQVAVTGSRQGSVEAARQMLPEGALAIRADSRSLADAERLCDQVREHFGALHGLFLNAGVTRPTPIERVDEQTWDEAFGVNAKGAFFTLQRALDLLVDGGSVVFTVGVGVHRGMAGASVAAGSRGALLAMVPSLAAELAPRRIRVNAVSPGAVDTPIWDRPDLSAEQVEGVKTLLTEQIPFGRLGRPRDVAETVAFLMSDGASYVTGQEIAVAGGL